ncbi:MAG TPA: ATP-binding protein [Chryseolinea sp.]|nr:ATP-binding protein [Chryseolinea sp.]
MNSNDLPTVRKVAVIGPECTGKSAISEYLAGYFHTGWVPEYARGYINNLVRPYVESDLLTIAHGQMRIEDEWVRDSSKLVICDTNLYVIKVWSEFKFGRCDQDILKNIASRHYDLYLLTYVDIPWEQDPSREHPNKREELYQIYLNEMNHQSVPYVEIKGEREHRQKTAVDAIEKLLR